MLKQLQRLTIFQQSDELLSLRELPITDWIFVTIFFALGFVLTFLNYGLSAVVAWGVGAYFAYNARIQYIVFDRVASTMTVVRGGIARRQITRTIALGEIAMAYLYADDAGASQAVLILKTGMFFGLSVRSHSGKAWKEEIVAAVNGFLRVDPTTLSLDDIKV